MKNVIMERILIKNDYILELEKTIKSNKNMDLIIKDLKVKGMPFVEVFDEHHDLVTFIYNDSLHSEHILLMIPIVRSNMKGHLMEKIADSNLWYATYKIKNNGRFHYRFSPNDSLKDDCKIRWDNCVYDALNPNYTTFISQNLEEIKHSIVTLSHADPYKWTLNSDKTHKGKRIKHEIKSSILNEERAFSVYLPYGYESSTEDFAYVLVLDGHNHLSRCSTDHVLDNLIDSKEMPKTIGLFLKSNQNRAENLRCSETFSKFIIEEFLPMVKELYRLSKVPKEAIICGSSLGGLSAMYMGLNHANVFGNVLSQSGSFWYRPGADEGDGEPKSDNCWMSKQLREKQVQDIKIYMNVGLLEIRAMKETNDSVYDTLLELNYDVHYEYFMGGHDYLSWSEYLAKGLISLHQRRRK